MNVAILHYHLRSGGVSSVLRAQAEALGRHASAIRLVALSGTRPNFPLSIPVHVVPELDYPHRTWAAPKDAAASLATAIGRALDAAFPGGCELLHVHNPLIHKNPALLEALGILQGRGVRLLVQVHDLAEDFRPDVYAAAAAYPAACAYATINRRDREALVASGLDGRHVHFLPNPVELPPRFEARRGFGIESRRGRRTMLYPVRAIRRKNLGEALLVSRYAPKGAELAVTLPPTNPRDLPTYSLWKTLASELELPIRFEAGLSAQLAELYGSSFCALTSSVKEGFGYAYLDPLARGIPVVGREIPYVVEDFRKDGLSFPGLYREIRVPAGSLPPESLAASLGRRLESFRRSYSAPFAAAGREGIEEFDRILGTLASRFEGEWIDFGALDEGLQSQILRSLDGGLGGSLVELNPFLPGLFEARMSDGEAEALRAVLARAYSDEAHVVRLLAAYRDAVGGDIGGAIDRRRLLGRYLRPEAFFMAAS